WKLLVQLIRRLLRLLRRLGHGKFSIGVDRLFRAQMMPIKRNKNYADEDYSNDNYSDNGAQVFGQVNHSILSILTELNPCKHCYQPENYTNGQDKLEYSQWPACLLYGLPKSHCPACQRCVSTRFATDTTIKSGLSSTLPHQKLALPPQCGSL